MLKHHKGLTLIEVLIIIVMIGILLTLVIQKIGGRKRSGQVAALQTDVRNAREAESKYFAVHNMYGTLAQLDSARLFTPAPGNTVTITVTATGYTATSTSGSSPTTCTLAVTGGESAAASVVPDCK